MISQKFIQNVLEVIDIVDIIGRYLPLKKGGTNYISLCPFHNEKSPSFTVSQTKKFYHCFGCGAHGTAINFVTEYLGLGFVEVVKDLAQSAGIMFPKNENYIFQAQYFQQQSRRKILLEIMTYACNFYQHQLRDTQNAIVYLKNRGLTGEVAAKFNLGFAPNKWRNLYQLFINFDISMLIEVGLVIDKSNKNSNQSCTHKYYDRFRSRIMFPIRNIKGQVIGFGGRIICDGEPKYLNSPETCLFQKGEELYGLFEARQAIREVGYVLVTEGYMDVLALVQLGFAHTVATLGTACTEIQIKKLLCQTNKIIFSFDGDVAGRRAARRALDVCLAHISDSKIIQFLFLPSEHDPDSYIRKFGTVAFSKQIEKAMPLSQFLIEEAVSNSNLMTPEGRAQIQCNAKSMLRTLIPSSLRLQIIRSLATLTQSTPEEIENLFVLTKPITAHMSLSKNKNLQIAPVELEHQIIRLLVTHPKLIANLDHAALDVINRSASDSTRIVLVKLIETFQNIGENVNFMDMIECVRKIDTSFDVLISEISIETQSKFETVQEEMADAIRQIKIRSIEKDMRQLVMYGLKDDIARSHYRELMYQKEQLKQLIYKKFAII